MGEVYDARLELPGWDTPGFDDKRWPGVELFDDPGMALVARPGRIMLSAQVSAGWPQ